MPQDFELKKMRLLNEMKKKDKNILFLKKKTASNLFRYMHDPILKKKGTLVEDFDNIISIDIENAILDVEGLATYEKIVNFTLSHGFLPTVAPELKDITVGGAIVGIGIESTSYKYGFVHDGVMEAEVLLPEGKVMICRADNENADLFHALANSYGTLGYILRAKIKLYPAKQCVKLQSNRYHQIKEFINALELAVTNSSVNFIEGLVFAKNEFYVLTANFVSENTTCEDIYRKNIFYQMIKHKNTIYLSTKDYIFRYDPDWFWNIPETKMYQMFRKYSPLSLRSSGFYKKYIDFKKKLLKYFGLNPSINDNEETLIQDWEVPWQKGVELLEFALTNIDLFGKPWAVVPIKPRSCATLYPLVPNTLYFNLGCYSSSKRSINKLPYYNTKIMDDLCFSLGGLKMLYSSTLLSEEVFYLIYNGECYKKLKQKYDPYHLKDDLYKKVAFLNTDGLN